MVVIENVVATGVCLRNGDDIIIGAQDVVSTEPGEGDVTSASGGSMPGSPHCPSPSPSQTVPAMLP